MTPKSEQDDNIIITRLQKDPGHDLKSGLALIDAKYMSKHMSLEINCAPRFSVARLLRIGYYSSSRLEWVQPVTRVMCFVSVMWPFPSSTSTHPI